MGNWTDKNFVAAAFFRWAGYLANPVRRADIHAELPSDKASAFHREYQQLTGESLLFAGDKKPFYIWPPTVNKQGIQRRVYFFGEPQALPPLPGITVRKGRVRGQWRINNKNFIPELFKFGFLIGDNADRADEIRTRIPEEHLRDFDKGFSIMSDADRAEMFLREQCESAGMRTLSIAEIHAAWKRKHGNLDAALQVLRARKTLTTNNKNDAVTYVPQTDTLKDEIESESIRRAIRGEHAPEKREYLIETYARDRGWKSLAKKIFGEHCMLTKCGNTFIKNDGKPYIEVHHIVPLHKGGEDGAWNLSVLCAHHHRMAHFARDEEKDNIKRFLLEKNDEMLRARS